MPTLLNLAGAKRAGLILANAAKVVEAVAIAAYSAGAHRGYIALPEHATGRDCRLEGALQQRLSGWSAGKGRVLFCLRARSYVGQDAAGPSGG